MRSDAGENISEPAEGIDSDSLATDVAQHTAQLHVHLDQDFLYPLDGAAGNGHQIASVPHKARAMRISSVG
jgi:hypothetical protein